MEIGHMAEWVQQMLAAVKPAIREDSTASIEEIIRDNDRVVILRDHILDFARRLGREELTDRESAEHDRLLRISMDLESLAHEIKGELLPVARRFREQGIQASETTGEMLEGAYDAVCGAVEAAVRAVVHQDESAAQDVLMHRQAFWRMSESVFQRQLRRLRLDDEDRLQKHRLQTDVLNKLRRLHGLAESMAATVLPDDVVAQQLETEPA
jgi:Na+/phosphate symporter